MALTLIYLKELIAYLNVRLLLWAHQNLVYRRKWPIVHWGFKLLEIKFFVRLRGHGKLIHERRNPRWCCLVREETPVLVGAQMILKRDGLCIFVFFLNCFHLWMRLTIIWVCATSFIITQRLSLLFFNLRLWLLMRAPCSSRGLIVRRNTHWLEHLSDH